MTAIMHHYITVAPLQVPEVGDVKWAASAFNITMGYAKPSTSWTNAFASNYAAATGNKVCLLTTGCLFTTGRGGQGRRLILM